MIIAHAEETEQVTVPAIVTLTLKPTAWDVYRGDTEIGFVSEGVGYYLAQIHPYGKQECSRHETRDEAVAAVLAGAA